VFNFALQCFQMVCDPNFRITSVVARWPGSVHDSRIWTTSGLCHQFENGMIIVYLFLLL